MKSQVESDGSASSSKAKSGNKYSCFPVAGTGPGTQVQILTCELGNNLVGIVILISKKTGKVKIKKKSRIT